MGKFVMTRFDTVCTGHHRAAASKWSHMLQLVGGSMRSGMLDVGELLSWALPRVAGTVADPSHTAAAAVLPMLQACIWVRFQSPDSNLFIALLPVLCPPRRSAVSEVSVYLVNLIALLCRR